MYASLLSRERLQRWLAQSQLRLYWRSLTPLVVLWGMLYQRLNPDHTCDAALCYLRSGAVDRLHAADPHARPLSQSLHSESTSAYVQGRNRLPLALVQMGLRWVAQQIAQCWLGNSQAASRLRWHGRAVRVLDGTTFRLRPYGDLAETYGQARNGRGLSYWVTAKSLASFCLYSQACLGYAEGGSATSEPGQCRAVLEQEPEPHCIYIADQGLGVYRVAQVAQYAGHDVVLRLERRVAKRLLRLAGVSSLPSDQECLTGWLPAATAVCEPDLPQPPIAGRLLYRRITPPGFRPFDVYLFTTLLDAVRYPLADICALYALRWRGELDYRHIKTVLHMEQFDVQSAAMFRKELAVGLLAYNLICALMTQAALEAGSTPNQLSFTRCLRRVSAALTLGMPAYVLNRGQAVSHLLQRLARCRLPQQPSKVRHEPRRVRHRPVIYPCLWGDRSLARQQLAQAT